MLNVGRVSLETPVSKEEAGHLQFKDMQPQLNQFAQQLGTVQNIQFWHLNFQAQAFNPGFFPVLPILFLLIPWSTAGKLSHSSTSNAHIICLFQHLPMTTFVDFL